MAERLSRKKAIRNYCLGCCCDQPSEVRRCPTKDCPLYPFRLGITEKTKPESQGEED